MKASDFEDLLYNIYNNLKKYWDNPDTVFNYDIDEEKDEAILVFNAGALDWLCQESEEPEFWNDIRDNSKFGIDFHGTYYQLRIPVVFRREEESEDARSLRLAIEMMDDNAWNEIRSKVYRTDIYTTEKFINELKDVLKKYFDVSTFWFFKDEDGHRNVAFYYKGQMVILKFYSNSMKHEVVIADTKTRLIIESMERERF